MPGLPEGRVVSGIELREDTLVVDREPNDLDDLAITVSTTLDSLDIDHVFVSGYVAILAGRSRATEDIDVLLERISEDEIETLVDRLEEQKLWGPAMPLDSMADLLEDDIWIARAGEMVPHVEAKFVDDEFDRASLDHRIAARITGADVELPIGPLELQIAYKLYLGTRTDFEDAVHLHAMFEETLNAGELQRWVAKLGVETEYDRLEQA